MSDNSLLNSRECIHTQAPACVSECVCLVCARAFVCVCVCVCKVVWFLIHVSNIELCNQTWSPGCLAW